MKVVFLSDDFPPFSFGGAGFSSFELARAVQALGHDVSVVTTCRRSEDTGEIEYEGLRVLRIQSDYHPRWRAWRGLYNPPVLRELRRVLQELKPDVVHTNNVHYHLSWAALKVARGFAPVVWTARDSMAYAYGKAQPGHVSAWANFKRARKWFNPWRNRVIKHYLSYAAGKFAVSEALALALRQNGIAGVEVLHTGIDASDWEASSASVAAFKAKFGLAGKKVVLMGGRLGAGKGGPEALAAMRLVRGVEPDAALVMMGTGDAHDGAIGTGWIDGPEKRAAYGAAEVVWVPSVYLDPLPRMALEAMAGAKPVVATNSGGAKEAVVHGETGFVADPRDARAWAEKTLILLNNPQIARAMGERGRERVRSEFNLTDVARAYAAVYANLAGK